MADKKAEASQKNEKVQPVMVPHELVPSLSRQCVRACMSTPVRTIREIDTLAEAQTIFLRYGHAGLCVVDEGGQLIGMLSRRDVDVALRHGLQSAQVLTCMSTPVRAIAPQSSLEDAHQLMVTYDIGRLPILHSERLVGIVTRSDLLRQLWHSQPLSSQVSSRSVSSPPISSLPTPNQLFQQFRMRSGPLWSALEQVIDAAEEREYTLYVVGGAVRDLLLSHIGASYPLTDIDLVVDGAQAGAGAVLASSVQSIHSHFDLKVYGEFQTASLAWSPAEVDANQRQLTSRTFEDASGITASHERYEIDIATARTEFYPYPAANPEVEASTIHQDLYRRDFTINAMALRLTGEARGQLLDFFGGWRDLQRRCIRVIHPNSFIEDPTRMFRALRFSTRLGFELDSYTQDLVGYAVDSPLYAQVRAHHQKVPALQSRLTAELEKVLSASQWLTALDQLSQLGALICVHPDLGLSDELRSQLTRMARWQRKFLSSYPRWSLLLVLLLAQLDPGERAQVAETLYLDAQSQHQLKHLHQWEQALKTQLSNAHKPSEIYSCLASYNQVEQLLIVARHPYTLGPQIWHHVIHLSRMSPLINGGTLKRLGYPPGPQYREILSSVHQLTLDGVLDTAESAESYVIAHYSRVSELE
ncbi:MAG: CBS domain-containing protein [Cyanobacteria bacterium J06650_10]